MVTIEKVWLSDPQPLKTVSGYEARLYIELPIEGQKIEVPVIWSDNDEKYAKYPVALGLQLVQKALESAFELLAAHAARR
jgi:hypothetical protein